MQPETCTRVRTWQRTTRCFAALCLFVCLATSAEVWRSQLFPETWTPGYEDAEGRFLHDFSYAGYHNGEEPLPETPPGEVFDVTQY
ncbi:MAG TPA: hypothetical protein ENN80_08440, partial [Candidatus Hydrogenedentes bacterium]|nr:hypothetical protein [Candidatus Hydrogenedentota bacterium]